MSGLLAGKVWRSALAPHLKPLAAALAECANDDGTRIFPSVAYVAWLLGRTERAVQKGLSALRSMGVLRAARYANGGRGKAVEYVMDEKFLPRRLPWKMRKSGEKVSSYSGKKGEFDDDKGRNLRQERVNPVSQKGEVGYTPPVITRQATVKDPGEREKGLPKSQDSNGRKQHEDGELGLGQDVVLWMESAARTAGKTWKHASPPGTKCEGNMGPTGGMIDKIRDDERMFPRRFRSCWLDFLDSPESDAHRFPYQAFLSGPWEQEWNKIGKEAAQARHEREDEIWRQREDVPGLPPDLQETVEVRNNVRAILTK